VLVRQIAVIRQLGVLLMRRVDDAVLLHQDDVVAEQLAAQGEHFAVRGERDEGLIVGQRASCGERVADGGKTIGAELVDLTLHHPVETTTEVGDVLL
jgi:hypothetical protein